MLCIPLGHDGTSGSAQWLHRPSRVYYPGENSAKVHVTGPTPYSTDEIPNFCFFPCFRRVDIEPPK